ncbi:MAG: GDP-mannose 4,6-dehydratase [Actinomycetota bacterium]|nr:GDP-mannose 4,6-dehydratase [Actinomycetota bacterium]
MRAFVTGGAGFIGSNLVERLLVEGHAVDVVDNLSTGSLANLATARRDTDRELSFQRLDIASSDMTGIMARRPPDVVYHLAARRGAAASVDEPVLDAEANIVGSLRVLEGARQAGARKVVFATSGAAIYGEAGPAGLPVKESAGHHPLSPHGVAKSSVAGYLSAYRELHDLEYTALALSSVYGPGQAPGVAGGVVATLAADLITGRSGTIYGDGAQTRDFVYVDDVIDALARAAGRGSGLTLNISTGVETSIRSLHAVVAATVGVDVTATYAPARAGEIGRSSLNPGRAAIHLGWTPWTTLDAGVAATVEWLRTARR